MIPSDSFGWSAGDITAAVSVAYSLIQALQTFTAWNIHPAYGKDIGEQVGYIKEPVENFLAAMLKYELSLGANAKQGCHRHVLRKWQWYMSKVLSLRRIASHMRVIDALMQQLLLYATSSFFFFFFWPHLVLD